MLTARATKAEHQTGETALQIAVNVSIGKLIYRVKEGEDFAVGFEEAYHWFVQSRQLFVWLIASWVMGASAVEYIAATVS